MRALSRFKLVVFLYTVLLSFVATAQFSLHIKDEKNKAVEDAYCVIQQLSSKKEAVGFSDENGIFKANFGNECLLQVRKLGYKTISQKVILTEKFSVLLERDNIDIKDVVVTGQSSPTTISLALQNIKVIDQQKIQAMGAVNLRDVLTNQLNVRLSSDPATGVSSMKVNGIGGQDIKFMIDGVPLIGRTNDDIDLSQINLSNIERIEIIEGPMSVVYGSDALGGVINLISKKKNNHSVSATVHGYYESVGTYNADARVGFKIKGVEISIAGGRNFFSGFDPNYSWQKRTQQWKPREQYFNNNSITFKTGLAKHTIASDLLLETIINRGTPDTAAFAITGADLYFRTQRWNIRQQSDLLLPKNNGLQFINSYQYYRRTSGTYNKNLVTGDLGNVVSQTVDVFYSALLRGIWTNTKLPKFTFRAGYDFNLDFGKGMRLENEAQNILDFGGYTTVQYRPVEKLTMEVGIRASYNTRYQAPVLPSVNVKYDFAKGWSLRTSYAMGFRAPSLKEMGFFFTDGNHNVFGNPTLKAEKSHNVQLVIAYEKHFKGFKVLSRPLVYFNQVFNRISLAQLEIGSDTYNALLQQYNFDTTRFAVVAPYTYFNIAKFQSFGVNWQHSISHKYFDVQFGYSLMGTYANVSDSLREADDIPHFVWSHEVSTSATGNLPKFKLKSVDFQPSISLFYKYNGAQPNYMMTAEAQAQRTIIQAYSILDLTATMKIWDNAFVLTGGVKNLLNVTNIRTTGSTGGAHSVATNSMSAGMGRTGFVALTINFTHDFKHKEK